MNKYWYVEFTTHDVQLVDVPKQVAHKVLQAKHFITEVSTYVPVGQA
jgi:hypothetical protein